MAWLGASRRGDAPGMARSGAAQQGHATQTDEQHLFFTHPVLINTLYHPAFEPDTLSFRPVRRDYYLVSVYDEDTNRDTLINTRDLRRLYWFDAEAREKEVLLPTDHSVMSSQYDAGTDYLYLYARHDTNGNGQRDAREPVHVFWIDLKDPRQRGKVY